MIFHIDTGELSLRDKERFLEFYLRHKQQLPLEIVATWNSYNNYLGGHVFITEEGVSNDGHL
jgi:hypothetical protein